MISNISEKASNENRTRKPSDFEPECYLSLAIPLYKSMPFIDNIRLNCEALTSMPNIEIIISDRHCLDDTIDHLKKEFGQDPRFKFLTSTDALTWTAHVNLLLSIARGTFFRVMPHDDIFPPGSLELLVQRLEKDPTVILAYGPTRALDVNGDRIPQRDRINTSPVAPFEPWQFKYSLAFNERGYCDGAFKGLFRRKEIIEAGLYIRSTYELVGAERAWLFGMSLLGGLGEESNSIYLKRYHSQSTHAQWKITNRHNVSITRVMSGYLWDQKNIELSKRIYGLMYLWRQSFMIIVRQFKKKKKRKYVWRLF